MKSTRIIPRLLLVLALLGSLAYAYPFILGATLQGYLGGLLSTMFGMQVEIQGLQAEVFSGHVKARRITFWNQSEFSPQPHFDVHDFEFWINFRDLLEKKVRVSTLYLVRPRYWIERVQTKDGPENNVSMWVDHILKWEAARDDDPSTPTQWTVAINKIVIRDGTVVYEETDMKNQKIRFVFAKLEGVYDHFFWRPPDQDALSEIIDVEGTFGEKNPAPFGIKGRSNFAAKTISFELWGTVPDGDITEYSRLWEGLPLRITAGRYSLKTHVICKHEHLESKNRVVLKNLKLYPEMSVSGTLWGIPLMAGSAFLQQQKNIELKIPVNGDISNPKFRLDIAFRTAFQDALGRYTRAGVNLFKTIPAEVLKQTQNVAGRAPAELVGGMEKVAAMVVEGAGQVKSIILNKESNKKEENSLQTS
jgi:hypothetical protein